MHIYRVISHDWCQFQPSCQSSSVRFVYVSQVPHHNDLQWIIDAVWPRARANMANNREDSTIQTGGDFYQLDHIRCSNISMGLKKNLFTYTFTVETSSSSMRYPLPCLAKGVPKVSC